MEFEPTTIGIIGLIALLALLAIGTHIAIVFLFVGIVGTAWLLTPDAALSLLGETLFHSIAVPTFVVLPLFVLMGSFASRGGFAERAYRSVHTMTARLPGSLAIATAFGSAVFGSICGSSLATSAIFGRIAYPEMLRFHYDRTFALGSIACSGTFACMIPPSGMFILFAIFTEQSVGRLFMAGILPGLLTAGIYAVAMAWRVKRRPHFAPMIPSERDVTLLDRVRATRGITPILILAMLVLGGIYTGIFTTTEAGAVGAIGTLVFGLWQGPLRRFTAVRSALRESAHTTSMLFIIIVTAMYFSRFFALTQIPSDMAEFLSTWNVHPNFVLASILALWFLGGMIMIPAAIFALTLPILFPIIEHLGFDPIWFCVIAMKLTEIAAVTPPVGLNAFALAGVSEDAGVEDVFRGVWPYVVCDIIVVIILIMFPEIVLFLPNAMLGG